MDISYVELKKLILMIQAIQLINYIYIIVYLLVKYF